MLLVKALCSQDLVVPVLLLLSRREVYGALLRRRADQQETVLGVLFCIQIICGSRFWFVTLLRIILTAIYGGFNCLRASLHFICDFRIFQKKEIDAKCLSKLVNIFVILLCRLSLYVLEISLFWILRLLFALLVLLVDAFELIRELTLYL